MNPANEQKKNELKSPDNPGKNLLLACNHNQKALSLAQFENIVSKAKEENALDEQDSKTGETALIKAILAGATDKAKILLDAGINIILADDNNQTARAYAESNDLHEIRNLIDKEITKRYGLIDEPMQKLIDAVCERDEEAVENALKSGVSLQSFNHNGYSVFFFIFRRERNEPENLIEFLQEFVTQYIFTAFHYDRMILTAAKSGNEHLVKTLLAKMCDKNITPHYLRLDFPGMMRGAEYSGNRHLIRTLGNLNVLQTLLTQEYGALLIKDSIKACDKVYPEGASIVVNTFLAIEKSVNIELYNATLATLFSQNECETLIQHLAPIVPAALIRNIMLEYTLPVQSEELLAHAKTLFDNVYQKLEKAQKTIAQNYLTKNFAPNKWSSSAFNKNNCFWTRLKHRQRKGLTEKLKASPLTFREKRVNNSTDYRIIVEKTPSNLFELTNQGAQKQKRKLKA